MASITIDGLDEEVFRRNIEAMLRVGEADRAAVKLRALLEPFATDSRILPARFLEVTAADFKLDGWEHLGECLARNDLPRHPISALTIAVSDAEALGLPESEAADAAPLIATSHFTDEAYMFSQCAVSDLLDGYSFYGCEWHGSSTHMDTALTLSGVEDLYRAVTRIEAELIASPQPPLDMIRAGSLASCFLAVLLFQAVRDTIRAQGLPRPLCVMAGNEGVYPYFDAPVIGSAECAELGLVTGKGAPVKAAAHVEPDPVEELAEERELETVGAGAYSALNALKTRKVAKKPVLELAEAELRSAAELLERAGSDRMDEDGSALDELLAHRGPSHPLFAPPPPDLPASADLPPEFDSGADFGPESGADAEPAAPPTLADHRAFDPPPATRAAPASAGQAAEPAAEPEPAGLDPFTRPGNFPEVAETAFVPVPGGAAEPGVDVESASEAEIGPDPERAAEPAPFRPQPSHSLRARFAETPAPPPPPPPLWKVALSTVNRWLHAIFG